MSKTQRELLSQNFLWNRELVSKLIRNSSISQNDSVLEIGAGKGIITEQLLGICRKLTAIESDHRFYAFLKENLPVKPDFQLLPYDFLVYPLPPTEPFKVFSNIPFSITGEIVKKLLFPPNPPLDSYLVVQYEAAEKFIGKKYGNTMLAVLLYPFFDIQVIHEFQRTDFKPKPRVDSCLIRLVKRHIPLVNISSLAHYRDFIVFCFTRERSATSLSPKEWISRFGVFMKEADPRLFSKIRGSFDRWRIEEQKLSKIHRTRTDKDWRKQRSDGNRQKRLISSTSRRKSRSEVGAKIA